MPTRTPTWLVGGRGLAARAENLCRAYIAATSGARTNAERPFPKGIVARPVHACDAGDRAFERGAPESDVVTRHTHHREPGAVEAHYAPPTV